jgi:hypothetical protein
MTVLFSNEGIVQLGFSNKKKIHINSGWIHTKLIIKQGI